MTIAAVEPRGLEKEGYTVPRRRATRSSDYPVALAEKLSKGHEHCSKGEERGASIICK